MNIGGLLCLWITVSVAVAKLHRQRLQQLQGMTGVHS